MNKIDCVGVLVCIFFRIFRLWHKNGRKGMERQVGEKNVEIKLCFVVISIHSFHIYYYVYNKMYNRS